MLTSCSLIISDPSSAPDAGAGEPPALSCAEGERADEIGRVCVPMTGTRTCEAGASVDAEHAWLKEASAVLYAAPQAAGDGSGSDAGNAGSLEAMVAAAGAEATAVLLAPGTYTLSDPLALAVRGPLSLVGPCAEQVIIELGAPMTTSGSVQLYGLAVRAVHSAPKKVQATRRSSSPEAAPSSCCKARSAHRRVMASSSRAQAATRR